MVFIIIFSVLTLIGIGCLIGSKFTYYYDEVFTAIGWSLIICCGIVLLCLAVTAIQANVTTSLTNQEYHVELTAKVEAFQSTYAAFERGEGLEGIAKYNADLAEFKAEVAYKQADRQNAWIGWFTSKAWTEVNLDELIEY